MTLDILVHPFFPVDWALDNRSDVGMFTSTMESLIANRENYVVIDHSTSNLNQLGENKTLFQSVYFPEGKKGKKGANFSGYVRQQDWDRFTDVLKGHDTFRVHGSYLGLCVNEFARQLFAYLYMGEHWTDISGEEKNAGNVLVEQDLQFCDVVVEGLVKRSCIKFGAVLPPNLSGRARVSIISPRKDGVPYGCDTYQFSDEQTHIYHREHIKFR